MYGLLIAKNLSTRSRYSHSLCVSANTKIKLKLKLSELNKRHVLLAVCVFGNRFYFFAFI